MWQYSIEKHQQPQQVVLALPLSCSSPPSPLFPLLPSLMRLYSSSTHSVMFLLSRAEVQMVLRPWRWPSPRDCTSLTSLEFTSTLLHRMITGMLSPAQSLIWRIQSSMELKDDLSVIENTSKMPMADRQNEGVSDWNFYCPAVSHICTSTFLPLMPSTLSPQSSPMVGRVWSKWVESGRQNLRMMEVLPTLESPTSIILIISSQLRLINNYNEVQSHYHPPNPPHLSSQLAHIAWSSHQGSCRRCSRVKNKKLMKLCKYGDSIGCMFALTNICVSQLCVYWLQFIVWCR